MRSRSRALGLIAIGVLFVVVSAPTSAMAAETASSELVIISEGTTSEGDLYAAGVRILIEGVVDGDLVAFAAEDVVISGEVTGSVIAVAPVVDIGGRVGGSARVAANDLTVTGDVEGDLVGGVISADLQSGSSVGGDVLLWAVNVNSAGTIGADLGGTQRSLDLQGTVDGDVDVSVRRLTITGPLEIGGDLGYRSPREAEGLDQATVGGVVVHKTPVAPNIRVRALGLVARALTVIAMTAIALLVAWGWPDRTRRAAGLVRIHPLGAWGRGALVILSPLILGGIAALIAALAPASASLPLLVIFVPLVLVALAIVLILSAIAGIPSALALGDALIDRWGMFGSLLVGSAIVGVLWLIPYVRWLVIVILLPLGLGAWMLSFRTEPAPVES